MSVSTRRRVIAGMLGAAAVLGAWAPAAATAAPAQHGSSVSVGPLVLAPTDRGYHGTLPITIVNRSEANAYPVVTLTEPVGGAFTGMLPGGACFPSADVPRRTISCTLDAAFKPGERRTVEAAFEVLTHARPYAMVATGGRVDVSVDGTTLRGGADVSALFRSTSGSLRSPRAYVQETVADGWVKLGAATLVQQPDGSYAGRLPVTVGYLSDAPHNTPQVELTVPEGVRVFGTDEGSCPFSWCTVPGGEFMPGERRTFDVLLTAPAEIAAGPLGNGTANLHLSYGNNEVPDRNPVNNTAPFAVTAVAAH
ncbi:hypothetical protein BDK92_4387 [Micromonospora pisi]|uniref:Secreted protein n=1 Tax=Micromonospora pisi TaxID=589240 RepID=A0A495JM76_9ACTN|nr:hypothetical protein [Micromonospora pisi]RKR90023.1 hypothetical protein BDK92_4387 [Micromonospora pisi]